MANPIPPLFCSTPPPIDDDAAASPQNDEGDFGDFTNAYQDNTSDYIENDFSDFNSSVPEYFEEDSHLKTTTVPDLFPTSPSIPPNDLNCDTKLSTHSVNVESDKKPEQLKKTTSLSSLSEQRTNSLSPETKSLDKADDDSSDKNFGDFQFSAINDANKDDSGRSSQSDRLFQEVVESVEKLEKPKCVETLANVVVLEDVTDDESDNECRSPRNRNNFQHCDEDTANFFALQPVNGDETSAESGLENKTTENETIAGKNRQLDDKSKESKQSDEALQQETVVTQEEVLNSKVKETNEEDYNPKEVTHVVGNDIKEDDFDDDNEFANFQNFTTTSDSTQNAWKASFEATSRVTTSAAMEDVKPVEAQIDLKEADIVKNYDDDDDDDDFGDFSEAPVYATPSPSQTPVVVTTTPTMNKNITSNLISMLDLMFPKPTIETSESAVETLNNYKSSKHCLELAIVESAKALDYQWIGSNMRHALIRSLGIDSRNIFLAEKWNPSMPRFAANLTFDPLQPLKPTSMPLQPEVVSSSNQKPSVPVAEFDWQSAGLVNPLDGSKTEMATQSADASNTESGASNVDVVIDDDNNGSSSHTNATNNDDDDTSSASSTYASAETSAIATSAASATLSPAIAGSGNIDAGSGTNVDAIVNEDLDVGYLESQDQSETSQPSQVAKGISTTPIFENKENLPAATTLETFEIKNIDELPFESVPIARSTFAGPLKETHIFTPTPLKTEQQFEEMRSTVTASTNNINTVATQKHFPIDFDYEKAAAGIIIDETVVRKEYRDIEYNPGFNLAMDTQTTITTNNINAVTTPKSTEDEFDDEFTDFQSVPPPPLPTYQTVVATKPLGLPSNAAANAATSNGMILSPAILLPQAISIESKQPKIEWGDSAASIDPDELARIEQLFPQDKNGSRSDSRKSTPTHGAIISTNSLSISASIASQQQQQSTADDDDWSDFVSVPVAANAAPTIKTPTRNNTHNATQQPSPLRNQTKRNLPPSSSSSNDEEWSDFVSSAPTVPPHFRVPLGMPQFNSASWQNANFYNNPLSIYHRNHMNAVPNATSTTKLQQNNNYNNQNNNHHSNQNNNNNNYTHGGNSSNNNFQLQQQQAQYLSNNKQNQKSTTTKTTTSTAQQLQQQQQIQIMQDFSTSQNTYTRPNMSTAQSANYAMGASNTPAAFQVGSAKVAPTVSLIPDLGFVAPAMPVHTAVINALPKPSTTGRGAAPPRK